jgi:LPXTG-motif cell wall-anchored protein
MIPEPTATPVQTVTPTPTEMNEVDKVPATGDNTNIWGLLCMLFVSGAVLLFLEKKKEQSCKNKNK